MTQEIWNDVDAYFEQALLAPDAALEETLRTSDAAGLPQIAVSPLQGKFLYLMARLMKARSILEIGTLGGYSTIWMARALPADGRLVTLEYDPKHSEVARTNIARAGLTKLVDIRVGAALETLPSVEGPFDLAFIDADKQNNPHYFEWALKLTRKGALIIIDNVVRDGKVADTANTNEMVLGVRRMVDIIAAEKRVSATAIQTLGIKGYDGFLFALVTG